MNLACKTKDKLSRDRTMEFLIMHGADLQKCRGDGARVQGDLAKLLLIFLEFVKIRAVLDIMTTRKFLLKYSVN